MIAGLRTTVEAERVLEAAAAAALNCDPEHLGLASRLLRHQVADLHRSALREGDQSGEFLFDRSHLSKCSHDPCDWKFVTPVTPIFPGIAVRFVRAESRC